MTEFQKWGIHAQVRADGDLYVNAHSITLGEAEGREFLGFLMTEYHQLDVARRTNEELSWAETIVPAAQFDELAQPTEQEQADGDEMTDDDYLTGQAPVIETEPEVGPDTVEVLVSTPDANPPVVKRKPGRPRTRPLI